MAEAIERLYKLTVDGTEAVRQLEKIAKSTGSIESQMLATGRVAKQFGAALAAAFAVGTIGELVSKVLDTSKAFDQLGKDAAKVGIAVEDLQRLRYAADLSGVSAEQMEKAIAKLAVGMQGLGSATSDASRVLKSLGVTSGDSPTAALGKIADHFAAMPNGLAKASDAIAIFGEKLGLFMLPLLNDGAAALRKMMGQAAEFGGVLTGQAAAAAARFNDDVSRLERTMSGLWRDVLVPMLPALTAIAKTMGESAAKAGDMKKSTASLGDSLFELAKGAVYTSQVVRQLWNALSALAEFRLAPASGIAIFNEWRKGLSEINRDTERTIDRLTKNFLQAKREAKMPAPPPVDTSGAEAILAQLDAQKKAQEEAAKAFEKAADAAHAAAEPARKLWEDLRDVSIDASAAQKALAESMERVTQSAVAITDPILEQAAANAEVTKSINAQIKAQHDSQLVQQAMILLAQEGTEAQKKLAGAWLSQEIAIKHMAPVVDDWKQVQDALGAGFDRFVDSLSSGSVTAAQAFKGMVQSILADLLKIAAKKFIIDAIFGPDFKPFGASQHAQGNAFDAGQVLAFARGGVLSQPVMMPMALMGEAGPEAVLPLKRGADGNLGVNASGGGALKVAIHNYADASVSARRDGNGDLQIIIEQTRKAIAADFRRGGTDVARAAESAYRLSRGAAAPF